MDTISKDWLRMQKRLIVPFAIFSLLGVSACSSKSAPTPTPASKFTKIVNSHKYWALKDAKDYRYYYDLYALHASYDDPNDILHSSDLARQALAQHCSDLKFEFESLDVPESSIKSLVGETIDVMDTCSNIGLENDGTKILEITKTVIKIFKKWEMKTPN